MSMLVEALGLLEECELAGMSKGSSKEGKGSERIPIVGRGHPKLDPFFFAPKLDDLRSQDMKRAICGNLTIHYWVILQDNDALIKLNEDASTEVMDEARWEHLQRGDGADMWVCSRFRHDLWKTQDEK